MCNTGRCYARTNRSLSYLRHEQSRSYVGTHFNRFIVKRWKTAKYWPSTTVRTTRPSQRTIGPSLEFTELFLRGANTAVSSDELQVSVVIASHNRAGYLVKALDGLLKQTIAPSAFEVIVVDNASTDDTRDQVLTVAKSTPNVRYLLEPTLGLSVARNTGWRAAQAPFVAFLDDDAIPAADWLECILRAFHEVTPHPACVGGRIEPIFEGPRPSWLEGPLLDHLTVVDHSPQALFLVDIIHRQKLAGANMAVERAALERIGGFPAFLDRVGTRLLSGGDVLVQLQLEKLNLPVYYDPSIHVLHHVSARRLTRAWMVDRAYWGGVSDALLSFFNRPANLLWAMRTLLWGGRSVVSSPLTMARLIGRRGTTDFISKCDAWHRLGFIVGGLYAVRLSLSRGA
jgi:glycosyltransferase involved in cell wall biosynthesis